MQIMSVRGTMISRVSVSDNVSTLRSISETSGIEIIGLHQAVDGGTPLFELNLLQLLVVGQVRFLGATLLTLLLARRFGKRRDRGGEPDTVSPS